jgi:hypothetical protein
VTHFQCWAVIELVQTVIELVEMLRIAKRDAHGETIETMVTPRRKGVKNACARDRERGPGHIR